MTILIEYFVNLEEYICKILPLIIVCVHAHAHVCMDENYIANQICIIN